MRFSVVSILAAFLTAIFLVSLLTGCGGSSTKTPVVASITVSPTTLSLNEGSVGGISAIPQNSSGQTIAADITFTSSNPSIATISTAGLVCGGVWDANFINCNPTIGQAGVGQVTITATSGNASATATVYVHLKVDRVLVNPVNGCTSTGQVSGCTSMGQVIPATAIACSTSAPGCSQSAPCDITSTVGPFTFGSNDQLVAANSSGIEPTFSPATDSPTYISGGTISGSKGQTCNLSSFGFGSSSGIDPTYSPVTNSPTYTSGGSIIGSTGQTCSLTNFNNGIAGATGTVALTGTDVIASGTRLTITSEGSGATSPPTTAVLSNGSATCSGTANVITALIGITGGQGVIGATATVALTSANTIASGTQLTVTNSGFGASAAPSTAVLTNGSATCSGTASVITALTPNSVFTAENPGATTIFAGVSGVNSVGAPYLTCPVVSIKVHDANSMNTSFAMTPGGTQPLTADVYDSSGMYIKPALKWGTSSAASATVLASSVGNNAATLTAVAPGTASITATCSYPNCNRSFPGAIPPYNVGNQYSQNVVTAAVSGTSATTVFAASTNSLSLVPINTSTNTAGTAITLPHLPNSILIDPSGSNLYLGSNSGIMVVNLPSNTASTLSVNGAVVALAPDSLSALFSDSVLNTVYYFDFGSGTITASNPGYNTASSEFTPDSQSNEWVTANVLAGGLRTGIVAGLPGNGIINLPYTPGALGISAQGGLTYITGSSPSQIDVRATCDQSDVTPGLSANSPTLIAAIPNGTGAVAADSPAVDVVATPAILSMGCPVMTSSTVSSVDMGAGAFNAQQLFMSPDSSRAFIISDLPELMYLNLQSLSPVLVPYAGGVTAFSGGITLDGKQVYVGTSDGTVHRIDTTAGGADVQQIAVNLKDANGNAVTPNLVAVQPH